MHPDVAGEDGGRRLLPRSRRGLLFNRGLRSCDREEVAVEDGGSDRNPTQMEWKLRLSGIR